MAKNIISHTNKSSRLSKRVREDVKLIKQACNVKFIIDRSEYHTLSNNKIIHQNRF